MALVADSVFPFDAFPGRTLSCALFSDVSNGGRASPSHELCWLLRAPRSELAALCVAGGFATDATLLNASLVRQEAPLCAAA